MAFHVACPITWYVIFFSSLTVSLSRSRALDRFNSRLLSQPSDLLLLPRVSSRSPWRQFERRVSERRSSSGGFSNRSLG